MEARKKYYTFGEALRKLLEDPTNLAITREKYLEDNCFIVDIIPDFDKFKDLQSPMLAIKKGKDLVEFIPTQEDIHSMNWICYKKVAKPTAPTFTKEDVNTLDNETAKKLIDTLNLFIHTFNSVM